tara:strand:+ start:5742 stop:6728 length:987 start_codon:yes stop_codon:yes gene_type:complete
MITKYSKNIIGLTLIEILIGIIITSIMMAAMYTSYNVVNRSYTQVSEKAKISRSSRDLISMLMRDIRMAGFRYYAGPDQIAKFAEDSTEGVDGCPDPGIMLPKTSYLKIEDSNDPLKHHNPLVIRKNTQGAGTVTTGGANDTCCDQIQISYEDFNQNDHGLGEQVYKRYRITYFADASPTSPDSYAVFKRVESYNQPREGCDLYSNFAAADWVRTCPECTREDVLVRDHIEDMEFIPIDQDGRVIKDSSGNYPAPEKPGIRDRLYDIRGVDIKLTFRSKEFFFNESSTGANQKIITGLSERNLQTNDRYLRDSVIVTVGTRNIGGQAF